MAPLARLLAQLLHEALLRALRNLLRVREAPAAPPVRAAHLHQNSKGSSRLRLEDFAICCGSVKPQPQCLYALRTCTPTTKKAHGCALSPATAFLLSQHPFARCAASLCVAIAQLRCMSALRTCTGAAPFKRCLDAIRCIQKSLTQCAVEFARKQRASV